MKTCVSISCPFALFCKDYNFLIDRSNGCSTQKQLLAAAERFKKRKRAEKRLKALKEEAPG